MARTSRSAARSHAAPYSPKAHEREIAALRASMEAALESKDEEMRSLAERLTRATEPGASPPFVSIKAANMFAATAVRFLYDVACEMAAADPERYEANALPQWHDCQKMLKNDKTTRGVGIVAYTDAAMALLKDALAVAREKVQAKIDAKATYEAAMRGAV